MDHATIRSFLETRTPLFAGVPGELIDQLLASAEQRSFEAQEAIIECGKPGTFVGVLLSGTATASLTDDRGELRILGQLAAGDVIGELSLMTGEHTVADVIASERCNVLQLPHQLVASSLLSHPPVVQRLTRLIVERSRRLEEAQLDLDALTEAATGRQPDPYGFDLRDEAGGLVLVVNCGSSSLKYQLFDLDTGGRPARGLIERIGQEGMRLRQWLDDAGPREQDLATGDHGAAFDAMMAALAKSGGGPVSAPETIRIVGHRVVHGGHRFGAPVLIDEGVLTRIEEVAPLAPLHNPVNLLGIRAAMERLPRAKQVAVFDTAFHQTMPAYAYLYGLPFGLAEDAHIRRYGFHGMSHKYVGLKAAQHLGKPFGRLEIISCHLGNGASICAIDHGRSVDTTMGMTPIAGLPMGTRAGDVDPGVLVHLLRTAGLDADGLDRLLNKESGLLGLSGLSNDMRELEQAAALGHHRALLAVKTFAYQVRKHIGAYVAAMQGLDALVFTGGIGQNSAVVRSLACQGLACMGIHLDEGANREAAGLTCVRDIASADSRVRVLVVPTDEELMIARESLRTVIREEGDAASRRVELPIPIEVSAHHVHLAQQHIEALFGPGHELVNEVELSQPGQYACRERVTLHGPKGSVGRVRVLGPARKETQVEISMTEQYQLGISPPIRASGDLADTPGVTLEGTHGKVTLDKGVICALRHIHMHPEDALNFAVRDRDIVRIRVAGERELTFGDVLVRVNPSYKLAMHIDTDEANAAHLKTGAQGFIEAIQSRGH